MAAKHQGPILAWKTIAAGKSLIYVLSEGIETSGMGMQPSCFVHTERAVVNSI
jgi:hypothetical protein